jgi:hypothetical protein
MKSFRATVRFECSEVITVTSAETLKGASEMAIYIYFKSEFIFRAHTTKHRGGRVSRLRIMLKHVTVLDNQLSLVVDSNRSKVCGGLVYYEGCDSLPLLVVDVFSSRFPARPRFGAGASLL